MARVCVCSHQKASILKVLRTNPSGYLIVRPRMLPNFNLQVTLVMLCSCLYFLHVICRKCIIEGCVLLSVRLSLDLELNPRTSEYETKNANH